MLGSKSYSNAEELINGALWIYNRKDQPDGYYYTRIKLAGRKSIYKSLGTKRRLDAIQSAQNLYYETRSRSHRKIELFNKSFIEMYKMYSKARQSLGYTNENYDRIAESYWFQYWNKHNDITKVVQEDLDKYWKWRIDYWSNVDTEPLWNKRSKADYRKKYVYEYMKDRKPSYSFIQLEVACYRSFFKWLVSNGYRETGRELIIKNPLQQIDKETVGLKGHFTDKEYRSIWRKLAENKKKSNKGNSIQKYWYALRLESWFFTMSNTGVRPEEANRLKWSMLQLWEDSSKDKGTDESRHTLLDLPPEVVKYRGVGVRKGRTVFSFNNGDLYDRLMKWRAVLNDYFVAKLGRELEDSDYMFPKYTDLLVGASMNKAFSQLLKKEGIRYDKDGRLRSAYSLRRYYIRQRISHGTPIVALAVNTGHTIKTLWSFYLETQPKDMAEFLTRRSAEQARLERMI